MSVRAGTSTTSSDSGNPANPGRRSSITRARWCGCWPQASPCWFLKTITLVVVLLALVIIQFLERAAPVQVAASISVVVVSLFLVYYICEKMGRGREARRGTKNASGVAVHAQSASNQTTRHAVHDRFVYDPPPSFTEATATLPTLPPVAEGVHNRSADAVVPDPNTGCSGDGRYRRVAPWIGIALLVTVLLAWMIVPFFVPEVPISTGISFTAAFVLAVIGSRVPNTRQAWKARRTRTRNRETGTENRATDETRNGASTGNVHRALNARFIANGGQINTNFVYEPPPSFTEAEASSPTATTGGLTAGGLPDVPLGVPLGGTSSYRSTHPACSVQTPSATGEPPPPYEEAVAQNSVKV